MDKQGVWRLVEARTLILVSVCVCACMQAGRLFRNLNILKYMCGASKQFPE